jgi:hypothetical protein
MAKKIKDLSGLIVNNLQVLEYAGKSNGTRPRCKWKCRCSCGNYTIVSTDTLTAGTTKSCGCSITPSKEKYIIKLQNRLLKYCEKTDSCWNWKGGFLRHGYGNTSINDKTIAAHRASWIAWKGDIPKGIQVLHRCDNPKCINPDHLFLGTQKDNMQDMLKKNRDNYAKGETSGTALLTNKQVLEIRKFKGKKSSYKICDEFGVVASTIRAIWNDRTWKHLPEMAEKVRMGPKNLLF